MPTFWGRAVRMLAQIPMCNPSARRELAMRGVSGLHKMGVLPVTPWADNDVSVTHDIHSRVFPTKAGPDIQRPYISATGPQGAKFGDFRSEAQMV